MATYPTGLLIMQDSAPEGRPPLSLRGLPLPFFCVGRSMDQEGVSVASTKRSDIAHN